MPLSDEAQHALDRIRAELKSKAAGHCSHGVSPSKCADHRNAAVKEDA